MGFFSKSKEEEKQGSKSPVVEERIDRGQLECRMIIEMLGKPKSHLEKTFEQLMSKFAEEEGVSIVKKTYSKTKKLEGMFSRFAEIDFWAKDLSLIVGLCFDYMPSSIEVLRPQSVSFQVHMLNRYLNELQSKLHAVDKFAKQAVTEKAILAANLLKMIENSVVLSLTAGQKAKNEIARLTGVSENGVESAIKSLLEQKMIKQQGDKYALAK